MHGVRPKGVETIPSRHYPDIYATPSPVSKTVESVRIPMGKIFLHSFTRYGRTSSIPLSLD